MRRALLVLVVVTAAIAGRYDILICHTDPGATSDAQTYIGGDPYYDSVTFLDCTTTTPSMDTLNDYGVVFTWSNYAYDDPTAFGNNLADYLDYYGGVVSCCFAHDSGGWGIAGRYASDPDYCPLTRGYTYHTSTRLGDYEDYWGIMDGVSSISHINYWQYISTESGAIWIADLENGTDMVAVSEWCFAAAVNLCPGDYHFWDGDGWVLYNNAIKFAIGYDTSPRPWVEGMDPDDGESDVPVGRDIVFHCCSGMFGIEVSTIVFTAEDQSRRSGDRALRAGSSSLSTSCNPRPAGEIPGTLVIDDSDWTDVVCTFTPDEDLPVDLITCTVDGCLADRTGREMRYDFVWSFTTEELNVVQTSWGAVKAEF